MEKEKKRALRRFHNARMLNRAKEMISEWYRWDDVPLDPKELHLQAKMRRDHMCVCSCSGCGNQRHNDYASHKDRLTMPEIKAEDSYLDAMKEYLTVDPNDSEE